jgi:N-acetylneuraminic acid mutarotase
MKKQLLFMLAICCAVAVGAAACDLGPPRTWTGLDPSGESPSARAGHSMVYDTANGKVILFGGADIRGTLHNDTWEYDPTGGSWTALHPSGQLPSPRSEQAMAYDSDSGKVFMFGGCDDNMVQNDIWVYDPAANTWTDLNQPIDGSVSPGLRPPARTGSCLVYDSANGDLLLFGGESGLDAGPPIFNDTWTYDLVANAWTNLRPSGALPVARSDASMVYDSRVSEVILFGGSSANLLADGSPTFPLLSDTWGYDPIANTWTALDPLGEPPSPRAGHSMVYDSASGKVVLLGGSDGSDCLDETWTYDPVAHVWATVQTGAVPPPRAQHAMAYDSARSQVILFGGLWSGSAADYTLFNDTWAFRPSR